MNTQTTPELGVCYYPEHWPQTQWASDATRMFALGIRRVRIGEFAWSRLEPNPGRYAWQWLDDAIETVAAQGLKIILGTPTACPPKWLVDQAPEILPVGADGRVRTFGSRRHYCFSSPVYREQSRRIVTAMAERYGKHPAVVAWQTDNEYGCHDTVLSYSAAAVDAFRDWLATQYESIDALNAAWGNVFWSMEYRNFIEIDAPVGTVTEANPAHRLDYQRFCSAQVAAFNRDQVAVLREHAPDADLVHNYMGLFTDFDHFLVGSDLDVASWDSYPLGFLQQSSSTPERKHRYRQQGDPDFAAFHHDLYRAVGNGRLWVMEQQPGPVNWASANAAPLPGMVKLWTLEAFAHGAELVSYFRWRQAPFAQEQMHAGLLLPDLEDAPAAAEVRAAAEALQTIDWQASRQAPVALVFSYEAKWLVDVQPQSAGFCAFRQCFDYYRALRRLGVDVDIVEPDASLAGYRVVVVPCLPILPEGFADAVRGSGAVALFGPRSGSKTRPYGIPATLPPGELQQLIPLKVVQVDSIREGTTVALANTSADECVECWLEHVDSELVPLARCENSHGVWYRHGNVHYLGACVSSPLLTRVMTAVLHEAGVATQSLPAGLRLRRRGDVCFAFNYSPEPQHTPCDDKALLLGAATLAPGEVSAWRI